MAIESIGSTGNALSTQRAQSTAAATTARASSPVLNAIQQTQQRSSNATAPVKVFAVPQTSKSGGARIKLPRGSIVDVLT